MIRRALVGAALGALVVTGLSVLPAPVVAGSAAPAYQSSCTEEDGSTPGQHFPCYWGGGSNGIGLRYVLTEPVCSTYEITLADASHARGYDIRLACDDLESLVG